MRSLGRGGHDAPGLTGVQGVWAPLYEQWHKDTMVRMWGLGHMLRSQVCTQQEAA